MNRSTSIVLVVGAFLFASQEAAAQPEEGYYYRIRNVNSGQVLTVENEGKVDGADKIVQALPKTNEIQLWKFVKIGDYYNIINIKTGKALNVSDASKEMGGQIIQWQAKDNASDNQQWSIDKHENHFVIKAKHSGMVLTVKGASKEADALLVQEPAENGKNQLFDMVSKKGQLAPVKGGNPGGTSTIATDSEDVVKAANYAIEQIFKNEKATLVKVLQAAGQVVAGYNYRLTLDVRTNEGIRTVYVEIYSGIEGKMELNGWEWVSDARPEKKKKK